MGAGGSRSRLAPAPPPPPPAPLFPPPDPVGETLFKDGKSQAWGSLSPGVQKGKSTAAPSPGPAPLPPARPERGPPRGTSILPRPAAIGDPFPSVCRALPTQDTAAAEPRSLLLLRAARAGSIPPLKPTGRAAEPRRPGASVPVAP